MTDLSLPPEPYPGAASDLADQLAAGAELLDLAELAEIRVRLADTITGLERARRLVDDELARRVDAALLDGETSERTMSVDGWKVAAPLGGDRYQDELLRAELLARRVELGLTAQRIEDLFATKHSLRRDAFKALAGQVPGLLELRDRFRRPPGPRQVKVERRLITPLPARPLRELPREADE